MTCDIRIGSDDIQLMVQLGISPSYIENFLELDLGCISTEYLRTPDSPIPSELTPAEVEILRAGGASVLDESVSGDGASQLAMALGLVHECRVLIRQCYDLATVADLLQTPPEEVRLLTGSDAPALYAFRLGDDYSCLFPQWQFTVSGTIPNLGAVLAAVGKSVSPLAISRFMLSTTTDLENGAEYFCPRDWLAQGFDTSPVLIIAEAFTAD